MNIYNNKNFISSSFQKIKQYSHKLFFDEDPEYYDFTLNTFSNAATSHAQENNSMKELKNISLEDETPYSTINDKIYPAYDVNLEYLKVRFNSLINSDIIIREFTLSARNKQYKSFIVYIDGMSNPDLISNYVLKPLMLKNLANSFDGSQTKIISEVKTNNITVRKIKKFDINDYIKECLLPQNDVRQERSFDDIVAAINSGNCALFVDTLDVAYSIDVKGFSQRSLETPNNEMVVKGSQVGFTENLRTNTSLLRRYINNESLIIESLTVGKISKTSCAICYLKNVANSDLVNEVHYRLSNLNIDHLTSSGQLEQLIQDDKRFSFPQIISTERPDKTSNLIFEGRVAIIVNGSPYILIAPATFSDFLLSPEDLNLKHQYSNFIRFLRFSAYIIAILLPSIYMAITNFHQELIPTELLYSIVSSRENVPFPILFELLIMEFSFELIKEASIRVPTPVGSTIGIVGALILGQAVVEASIVSPILIIIVALTGICSFSIPDFTMSFHSRILRFIFTILGALAGFLGLAAGLIVYILILTDLKSFGISYFQNIFSRGLILPPAWKRETRSSFLHTKRPKEQDNISMAWKYKKGNN